MRVIKDRQIIEDAWLSCAPNRAIPESGDVIVSLAEWNAHHAGWRSRHGRVGVRLESNEQPSEIVELDRVPLVAIVFPVFTDGRGYSIARLLRERLGYRGELRALGEVLRDQLFYLARCGIDSFALPAGKDLEAALAAFRDFSVTYQAAADERRPLFRRVRR